MGVNVGFASRPPNSERYRLLPLAKLTEHVYYYKHMAHRSPYRQGQNHKATEATRCLMPESQEKTPCSKLPKRNPDSKPNSDTTPASDGQTQRPDMAANGRGIEISEPNSDTIPASDGQTQRPDMSANGRGIEISEPNSDTAPASDGQTQRPDMSANDREIEFSELPFRQQAALPGKPSPGPWPRPPETPA